MINWSKWLKLPDPREKEYLYAPFGPGVYELRRKKTKRLILFGKGNNVAYRMSSLLPKPYGCGGRENKDKRKYVLKHIEDIEYRTLACKTSVEAHIKEKQLKKNGQYIFNT